LLGHLLPSRAPRLRAGRDGVREERVALPDGDVLVTCEGGAAAGGVVVHLFHGVAGSIDADYMRRGAALVRARGDTFVAANHRGCGAGAGLARGTYHSGSKDDLAAVIAAGRARHPHARHIAVGHSLSGNALLLLLAQGGAALPDAAIAVNPPVDLAAASLLLSRGFNRLYDLRFVARARRQVAARARDGLLERSYSIPRLATLTRFDDLYTAPTAGFTDAQDYYRRCSTVALLERIEVPVVVIAAEDDPFVPYAALCDARRAPAVHLHLERHGGHLGYLHRTRTRLGSRRWLDLLLDHFLDELA
jgi:hypothetical protein